MNMPIDSILHPDMPAAERSAGFSLPLLGALTSEGADILLPGGVYALVPQSPPARFPLWANFLQHAAGTGAVCHVLTMTDPAQFLQRLEATGWPDATAAWRAEQLRLYAMADGFAKLLFRRDVPGLTQELAYWGVQPHDFLLVDAGEALLSLHDVYLATSQLIKLKAWAKEQQVCVLLSFSMAASGADQAALTALMDHFAGMARLSSDDQGPTLALAYWQSEAGTFAERVFLLAESGPGYRIRPPEPPRSRVPVGADAGVAALSAAVPAPEQGVLFISNDEIWSRELQLLTQSDWRTLHSVSAMLDAANHDRSMLVVLRFGGAEELSLLANDVHRLRLALGSRVRIVVAEHRVSLRYTNELMLLKLGVDAVIRKDVALGRWPAVLVSVQTQAHRPQPDVDVDTALANAAMPQGRGFLMVPAFLEEVKAAMDRAKLLGVPCALAELKVRTDRAIGDAIAQAEFRRGGDFMTSDGEKLYVFFNACSITRGPEVLALLYGGQSDAFILGVDWMASQTDTARCIQRLTERHAKHPIDVVLQPVAVLQMPESPEKAATAGFDDKGIASDRVNALGVVPFEVQMQVQGLLNPVAADSPPDVSTQADIAVRHLPTSLWAPQNSAQLDPSPLEASLMDGLPTPVADDLPHSDRGFLGESAQDPDASFQTDAVADNEFDTEVKAEVEAEAEQVLEAEPAPDSWVAAAGFESGTAPEAVAPPSLLGSGSLLPAIATPSIATPAVASGESNESPRLSSAVRVSVVVPHEPGVDAFDATPSVWPDELDEAAAAAVLAQRAEQEWGSSTTNAPTKDVSALIRRLARPAPESPSTHKQRRQSGHY